MTDKTVERYLLVLSCWWSHENLQTKFNPSVYREEKTNSSSPRREETNLQTMQEGGKVQGLQPELSSGGSRIYVIG